MRLFTRFKKAKILERGDKNMPLAISFEDFIQNPPPEENWLIENIWQEKKIGFIAGIPKTYKSFLALEMARSVSSADLFLGEFCTKKARVLLVQEESTHRALYDRIDKMFGKGNHDFLIITNKGIKLDNDRALLQLRSEIKRIRPAFVILDPLYLLHNFDENVTREIGNLMGVVHNLRDEFGCAICIVHHMRKPGPNKSNSGQEMRGSSVFHASSECSLYVASSKKQLITIRPELKEGASNGFMATFDPDTFRLRCAHKVTKENILDSLNGNKIDIKELCGKLGVDRKTLDPKLKELVEWGKICKEEEPVGKTKKFVYFKN